MNQWEATDDFLRTDFNEDNAKIEDALTTISGAIPKIKIGTYAGNGSYGSENPNKLTFDFHPNLVVICNPTTQTCKGVTIPGTNATVYPIDSSDALVCTWSGNTLSWSTYRNAANQYNTSGQMYYYFAL